MSALLDELEQTWHTKIPISRAMDIEVLDYDGVCLSAKASLAANVNVHGTAFAGSIYAVCALVGWGMTWLKLKERDINGSIVIAHGQIDYTRPVDNDFVARCRFDDAAQAAFADLETRGKSRFPLTCAVQLPGAREAAAQFTGSYAVLALHSNE